MGREGGKKGMRKGRGGEGKGRGRRRSQLTGHIFPVQSPSAFMNYLLARYFHFRVLVGIGNVNF